MILFVGSKEAGYFCEDVAKAGGMQCSFIEENIHIENHANEILNHKEKCKYIVYHIEQYIDEADVIVSWIQKINKAINAKTIILAQSYSPQSEIIIRLYHAGVKNFIFSSFLSEKKEDMERCINGFYETYGYESRGISFDNIPDEEEMQKEKQIIISKSIGIAGAISRIGTTTQAIQFCKYLLFKGYKPAYIQLNDHKWVEALIEAYSEVKHDKDLGKAEYQQVDMFYKIDKIPEVLKMDYDFFIYDYGVYSEPGFSKVSFLEKEKQIFVVGSKPGEFDSTYNIIKSNFYQKVYYIFNFVSELEQKELKRLMADKSNDTFFAGDIRDPFIYLPNEMFSKILPVEQKNNEIQRKGFFRRKNKGEK